MSYEHVPVLLKECIEGLNIRDGGIYVDLTLGRGGHSSEILKRIPNGKLFAFDQDEEAMQPSRSRLESIGNPFELIASNFENVKAELAKRGVHQVDGILADLGVSSPQLDDPKRGFSYKEDEPLDMRMDLTNPLTAARVCNEYSLSELTRILRQYGEEKDAYRIAQSILRKREVSPLRTTLDLVQCVKESKTSKELSKKGHPAKQTFQAIRIEVNHEEASLCRMLQDAPSLLKSGGRLAIITFMSIDDRVVKDRFRELSTIEGSRHGPALLPEQIGTPEFRLVNRKPIVPTEAELDANHRAASAKLRILEKR
ncbi:MAG: 16S rRNA (cytosine(1402)-N(4))-methyltransferase RsmH [Candidatus Enteromonas sp.]|nr:16S rRNA (cytosine(1402)-N(4))-methyltransferase RsmH [Candidatus Enteromonas sp.]